MLLTCYHSTHPSSYRLQSVRFSGEENDAIKRLVSARDDGDVTRQGSQFLDEVLRLAGKGECVAGLQADLLYERFAAVTRHDTGSLNQRIQCALLDNHAPEHESTRAPEPNLFDDPALCVVLHDTPVLGQNLSHFRCIANRYHLQLRRIEILLGGRLNLLSGHSHDALRVSVPVVGGQLIAPTRDVVTQNLPRRLEAECERRDHRALGRLEVFG